MPLVCYGKCSKISNTSSLPKRDRQKVQTQIRLLLKKPSDQGLPCLPFRQGFYDFQRWYIYNSQHFICGQKSQTVRNFRTLTVSHIYFHGWLYSNQNFLVGPWREQTCLQGFVNNKGADQPAHPRRQISAFVNRFLESIISKLATSEILSF